MAIYFQYPAPEIRNELTEIAQALAAPGKGILNADSTEHKLDKQFEKLGLQNIEENRRLFRQVVFTNVNKMKDYISGIFLHREVLSEAAGDGTPFVELLQRRKIILGIKFDATIVPIANTYNEFTTDGLDNLINCCEEYKSLGCDFGKWRVNFKIDTYTPTPQAIIDNATILARFASICQTARIVPMLEIVILPDGNYDIRRKQLVTERILATLFKILNDHHIFLEAILLKINMVTPGVRCIKIYSATDIARFTVEALRRCVPAAVPGIFFAAGDYHEDVVTKFLIAVNSVDSIKPWALTFAYGEALYGSSLVVWNGQKEHVREAQALLTKRCKLNSLATQGISEDTFVADKEEEEHNVYSFPV